METLRQLADRRGMLIGAACNPEPIEREADYRQTLAREFNCITAENCMKFSLTQPHRGKFDFAKADSLAAFARDNRMKLRGHTLVWHHQLSDWVRHGEFSKAEALDVMREHIFEVVGHFRGRVFCWDVVNEALNDENDWRAESPWFRMIGPEYVEHAFRFAHEADPSCQLFYNDYGMEMGGPRTEACHRMLQDMLARGVPIHGVGFQYHLGAENRLEAKVCVPIFRRFADLGLIVHFTEMDMGIRKPITDEWRRIQAEEWSRRIRIGLDADVKTMVFWGFTDRHSWTPGFTKGQFDEALLFDRQCKPKAAYYAIADALRSG